MSRILVLCFLLFGSISFSAQTAEDIIEMNLKARGGKEKILSLKNMKMDGISIDLDFFP
jgi:hypothetical protein